MNNKDNVVAFLKDATQPTHNKKTIIKLEMQQCKMKLEFYGDTKALETEKLLTLFLQNTINRKDTSAE